MAHQFIIYGLPDSILMLCMHLDTPREAFAYLECRYGPIPRPESIKVADEAMPQCDMQSEQYATEEGAQGTYNSNNKPIYSPEGEDSLDIPNDCAETKSRYLTPETEVVDARHVEPYLLEVEVGATGVTWLDEHTNVLRVPDERGWHVDDIAEHTNLPESISEALEPADDISRSAGRCSIKSGPQTPIKDDQHLQMSGTLDAQDPQPADHICDTEGVYLEHAAAILLLYASEKTQPHLEEPGLELGRFMQLRETARPAPERDHTSGGWHKTYQGHFIWDTPLDEVWGMGVYSSAGAGWGYGMIVESTAMKLEIRDISAETTHMAPHLLHLETVHKEPDKAETGGGCNDAVSRDPVGSQEVEKTMLAGSGSQHGERKVKRPRCSPAPPVPCPNGTGHVLRTSRDPHRRGRLKMHAESHPPCLFGPMKRLRYPTGGYQTMKRGYNQVRRARKVETRGAHTGQLAFSCGSFYSSQIFRNDSGMSLIPTGGMGYLPDRRETTRNGRHTFVWTNGCLAAAIRGETTRAPLCITESGNTPQLNDASTQPHHARTTDGLEALHSQNTHSFY
ncbi:hypothetical protein F5141DRAFT_1278813 [Pisolithus sp. B1]|nr:hypothetical protein F5141DRAFT_1278813 [Pisolithus sp. B1]